MLTCPGSVHGESDSHVTLPGNDCSDDEKPLVIPRKRTIQPASSRGAGKVNSDRSGQPSLDSVQHGKRSRGTPRETRRKGGGGEESGEASDGTAVGTLQKSEKRARKAKHVSKDTDKQLPQEPDAPPVVRKKAPCVYMSLQRNRTY